MRKLFFSIFLFCSFFSFAQISINGGGVTAPTISNISATSNISAWNSSSYVTSATATNQTLPDAVLANLGKQITITNNGTGVITVLPFSGNTISGNTSIGSGESKTFQVRSIGVVHLISQVASSPVVPEALAAWVASTPVQQYSQRSITIGGVLTAISSNTARTTSATFNAAEAANWTYIGQSTVPSFPASSLVLQGFQITDGAGLTYQAAQTRVTGALFDVTENVGANWIALTSSISGNKVNVPNIAASGNILTAATSVDVASILSFNQTTTSVTGTLLNPTSAATHKEISLTNTGTADLNITSTGDAFTLVVGRTVKVYWNGTAWRLLNPAQVLSEFGTVALSTNTTIGIGNSSVATALLMPGMTFTAQSSGTFEVSIGIHSNQTAAGQSVVAILVNASAPTVAIANSETIIANAPSNGEFSGSKTFSVTANAGDVFQVRGYNNAGAATAAFITNTSGRSTLYWNKISTPPAVAGIAGAVQGQIIEADQTADYGNWILLDGRLKSTLTAAQQAVATALGYGINIPDMRGKFPIGALSGTYNYQTTGGTNTIAQNQLPNVAPTATANNTLNVGTLATSTAQSFGGIAWIVNGGTIAYGMNAPTISSINGNVTQQPYIPPYRATNFFVWLGPSAQTVTVTQPLSLTTTGNGVATLNVGTAALNIPNNSLVVTEGGTIGSQTLGSAAWQLVTGGSINVPATGQYKVEYSLSWTNPSANTLFTRITNAGGIHQLRSAASTSGLANTNVQNFVANYTAGDVIKLEWVHTTGTTTLVNNTAGTALVGGETFLRIIKLN
jgi:hypothetical protein